MYRLFIFFHVCLLLFFFSCKEEKSLLIQKQKAEEWQFVQGDIIFQDIDCGPMCDAINAVTEGYDNRSFAHIGLVYFDNNDTAQVIEAIGEEVSSTPLWQFLNRSEGTVLVGRLLPKYSPLIPKAVAFAVGQKGVAYDDAFLYDNGKYYCSELLYDAFKYANSEKPFFELQPMTFKLPNSKVFFDVWVEHYKRLGMPIPEGELGCNPAGLSLSDKIEIVAELEI